MSFLIAEISNHHCGSLDLAKELIDAAIVSGANAVKLQAGTPEDMFKTGAMPLSFYEEVSLSYDECWQLIEYGLDMNIHIFFTILSKKYEKLREFQEFSKLSASQFQSLSQEELESFNRPDTFISIAKPRNDGFKISSLSKAKLMYATDYNGQIDRVFMDTLKKETGVPIGLSHNLQGFHNIIDLSKEMKLPWIEKHFFLGTLITWEGILYRDCLHSLKPNEFETLAKGLDP